MARQRLGFEAWEAPRRVWRDPWADYAAVYGIPANEPDAATVKWASRYPEGQEPESRPVSVFSCRRFGRRP